MRDTPHVSGDPLESIGGHGRSQPRAKSMSRYLQGRGVVPSIQLGRGAGATGVLSGGDQTRVSRRASSVRALATATRRALSIARACSRCGQLDSVRPEASEASNSMAPSRTPSCRMVITARSRLSTVRVVARPCFVDPRGRTIRVAEGDLDDGSPNARTRYPVTSIAPGWAPMAIPAVVRRRRGRTRPVHVTPARMAVTESSGTICRRNTAGLSGHPPWDAVPTMGRRGGKVCRHRQQAPTSGRVRGPG